MESKENKYILELNDLEYQQLVKIAKKDLKAVLGRINIFALKYCVSARMNNRFISYTTNNELFLSNVILQKYNALEQLLNDDELCVRLWLENKTFLSKETQKEKMEKFYKVYAQNLSEDNDKPIAEYSEYEVKARLLKNSTECFEFSNDSPFGVLCQQMSDVFHKKEEFLQPCYKELTLQQLPVPLEYHYEQTDGISIRKYADGQIGKYTKLEKKHLAAAMKISDTHFLKIWASEPFVTLEQIYSYDEEKKKNLVQPLINDLLAYTVGLKSYDYCFGKLSEESYKLFSSKGYDPKNLEHAHLYNIFTHYLTTEELQSSSKELKKTLMKFRV